MGVGARVVAGLVVFVAYSTAAILRGSVVPGLVAGALAGVVVFLLFGEIAARRRRRGR